jgi:hypothetical protein
MATSYTSSLDFLLSLTYMGIVAVQSNGYFVNAREAKRIVSVTSVPILRHKKWYYHYWRQQINCIGHIVTVTEAEQKMYRLHRYRY